MPNHIVRHRGAHGLHPFQHEAGTPGEVAAPGIVALIGQRGEELVHQVAMRRMQLDEPVAGGDGTAGGGGEGIDGGEDVLLRHRARLPQAREGDGAGGHRRPAIRVIAGNAAMPGRVGAGLAAGMGDLRARHRAGGGDQARQPSVAGDLRIVPQAQVLRRDAALRRHCRGFRDHQPGAADGAGMQVGQVPIGRLASIGTAGAATILAHRRDADAVADGDAAKGKRGEEVGQGKDSPRA
jgi:hypothetical protein